MRQAERKHKDGAKYLRDLFSQMSGKSKSLCLNVIDGLVRESEEYATHFTQNFHEGVFYMLEHISDAYERDYLLGILAKWKDD